MRVLSSLAIGLIFAVLVYCRPPADQNIPAAAQAIASLAGTVFGALVAALAIVTAVMDRALLTNMRKTGHWSTLVFNTAACSVLMLATASVSIAVLFVAQDYSKVVLAAAAAIGVAGLVMLLVVAHQYKQVIKHL